MSYWLLKLRRIEVWHYLVRGAWLGTFFLICVLFLTGDLFVSAFYIVLVGVLYGGIFGFFMAFAFWFVLRPDRYSLNHKVELKSSLWFCEIGLLCLPVIILVSVSLYKSNLPNKEWAGKQAANEAAHVWINTLPLPQFATLSGSAPFTLKMISPSTNTQLEDGCESIGTYVRMISGWPMKSPVEPRIQRSISWGDGVIEIYAIESTPACLLPMSHIYEQPGLYTIDIYKAVTSAMGDPFQFDPKDTTFELEKTFTVTVTPPISE